MIIFEKKKEAVEGNIFLDFKSMKNECIEFICLTQYPEFDVSNEPCTLNETDFDSIFSKRPTRRLTWNPSSAVFRPRDRRLKGVALKKNLAYRSAQLRVRFLEIFRLEVKGKLGISYLLYSIKRVPVILMPFDKSARRIRDGLFSFFPSEPRTMSISRDKSNALISKKVFCNG